MLPLTSTFPFPRVGEGQGREESPTRAILFPLTHPFAPPFPPVGGEHTRAPARTEARP
jgi:hypothetical protein